MRNYSVSPRASPVCGGSILCIEGIDDHLITEQDITVLAKTVYHHSVVNNQPLFILPPIPPFSPGETRGGKTPIVAIHVLGMFNFVGFILIKGLHQRNRYPLIYDPPPKPNPLI